MHLFYLNSLFIKIIRILLKNDSKLYIVSTILIVGGFLSKYRKNRKARQGKDTVKFAEHALE